MPQKFLFEANIQGPSIKDVRSRGKGICPVREFCGQRGRELQMRTSAL